MNPRRTLCRVILVALSAVGCGGGDDESRAPSSDLAGMYQLVSSTLARPCDAAPVDGSTTGQACGGDTIPDATLTKFRDFECWSIGVREGTRL